MLPTYKFFLVIVFMGTSLFQLSAEVYPSEGISFAQNQGSNSSSYGSSYSSSYSSSSSNNSGCPSPVRG